MLSNERWQVNCLEIEMPYDAEKMWNIIRKKYNTRVCVWARTQMAACPVCCRQMKSNIIRLQHRYNTLYMFVWYVFVCSRLRATHFSIIFCAISKPIKSDRLRQNYSATKLFVFRQINNIYIRNIVAFLFFSVCSGAYRVRKNELESKNESSIFHMSFDEIKSRFREVVALFAVDAVFFSRF